VTSSAHTAIQHNKILLRYYKSLSVLSVIL